MERENELEKFLSDKLSAEELNFPMPDISLIAEARKKVSARAQKKQIEEKQDFIYMIAAFLNFKVKLYQAVIATIITGGIIFYFTHENKNNKSDVQPTEYVSNLASANSSTVMSCTQTFGLNEKQVLWKNN